MARPRARRADPADIARAGVFISIDAEGLLSIDRGYMRPEDEVPEVTDPENEPIYYSLLSGPTNGATN